MKLKISRLFHWLYATLMFLPILMFIPTCLFYAFNEHVNLTEVEGEAPIYYLTNEVDSVDDLISGNVYTFTLANYETITADNQWIQVSQYSIIYGVQLSAGYNAQERTDAPYILFQNQIVYVVDDDYSYRSYSNIELDFVFNEEMSDNFYTIISFITPCSRSYVKEYQNYIYNNPSTSIFNAWAQVWNLPVFSWTQNSFITVPFSYITGLFGVQSDNSINYLFTYFASISICWLVFDILMYVPNLAHRWLDRSSLQ